MSQYLPDMHLQHSLPLASACGAPEYTNFVSSFHGCLDYIYMDAEQLAVSKVVPMPAHEDVLQYTALPNQMFPSDHLALICDLTWKQDNK